MERKSVMVREYATRQEFNLDEQKLSREGWSVEPTVNDAPQLSLLARIKSRFVRPATAATAAPAAFVITYSRTRPA